MTDPTYAPDTPDTPTQPDQPAQLTHLRTDGSAHMVDVTHKPITQRTARAQAVLTTTPDVVALIGSGELPKGEALGTARIAGIMAAKRTSDLIPLCHPLPLSKLAIDFETDDDAAQVRILATVTTKGPTGVEMEALTAASVAALTLYDMIKAVDKHAVITDTRVLAKSGGKSGDWSVE
ncbi:MAG: cyclic pyranopterin monophosphate synthase MoaC [Micrococcaceae bacterium]